MKPNDGKGNSVRLKALIACLVVLSLIGFVFVRSSPPKPKELFLHSDGMLSLGSRTAEKFPPARIGGWTSNDYTLSDHIILDTPPNTPISAWNGAIESLAIAGYPSFQLRLGGDQFNFHIPLLDADPHLVSGGSPIIIDLRADTSVPYPLRGSHPDVIFLTDSTTTLDRLLEATQPYRKPGYSMTDELGGMIRHRDEDARHAPPKRSLMSRIRIAFSFR